MTALAPVRPEPTTTRTKPVYGRRGKLPDGPQIRRFECACGKLIIRCGGDPLVAIEGYCRECKTHVVFEA